MIIIHHPCKTQLPLSFFLSLYWRTLSELVFVERFSPVNNRNLDSYGSFSHTSPNMTLVS